MIVLQNFAVLTCSKLLHCINIIVCLVYGVIACDYVAVKGAL